MKTRIKLIFIIYIFSHIFNVKPAFSCSCAPSSLEEHIARSSVIFEGIPLSKNSHDEYSHTFQFKVTRSWKGIDKNTVSVKTSNSGAACGYNFNIGEVYLVYGNSSFSENDLVSTGICSATKPIDESDEDVQKLGDPIMTFDKEEKITSPQHNSEDLDNVKETKPWWKLLW